jgi:hypothetical protein
MLIAEAAVADVSCKITSLRATEPVVKKEPAIVHLSGAETLCRID